MSSGTTVGRSEGVSAELRRARVATGFYFALTGIVLAVWTARIPTIKATLGLDNAQVGVALLAVALGALVAMRLVGRLADRFSSARLVLPGGVLLALSLIAPGFAATLPVLVVSVVFLGFGHGFVDVSMNTQGIELQRRYGRPILSSFHSFFSLGGLAGSGIGAAAAGAGISVPGTFLLTAVPLAVLAMLAGRWLVKDDARPTGTRIKHRQWSGAVVFLGLLCFCCLFGEGAVTDWSSTYLHDSLHSTTGIAPLGYGAFSITMALTRMIGDRLARRFGQVALVRGSGLLAGGGLGAALLIGTQPAAIIGFGVFGLGLASIVPQVFSAAGNRDPARSGSSVAQVSSIGYLGLLVAPFVIGPLAQVFTLPVVLEIPAVLALFVALCAASLRA
jgi:MFS family permease